MKKLIGLFLVFFVLIGQQAFCQDGNIKKVAILETVDKENALKNGVKLMVRSKLVDAITNTPGYEAYDRVNIASIMNEQNFQRTGMVSDDEIKQIGKMSGAGYVVIAEAAYLDDTHIMIYTTILSVETAKIEQTSNIQTSTDIEAMEKACRELADRLLSIQRGANPMQSSSNYGRQMSNGRDFVETAFGINMKMVYVEGGSFAMGCTGEQGSDCDADEKNTRRVRLDGYYIGMTEITQGQWQKVMGTSVEQQLNMANSEWLSLAGVGTDYPMYCVSWEEAMAFCQELSRQTGKKYTLPTEAQWEFAARGGNRNDGTKYSGSFAVGAVAWYRGNSGGVTHIVGSKGSNGLGLYDMSGNVYEWCRDWYADSYIGYQTDNPTGPSSGYWRVFRGGGWGDDARGCRVANRGGGFSPDHRHDGIGFRVVCLP